MSYDESQMGFFFFFILIKKEPVHCWTSEPFRDKPKRIE